MRAPLLGLPKSICYFLTNAIALARNHYKFNVFPISLYRYQANSLTPMSDQDRISPYNINTISDRHVLRLKKNLNEGVIT